MMIPTKSETDAMPTDETNASARAYRGAAMQALTSLGQVGDAIHKEMAHLSKMLDQAATPDVMLADPDSPINILETLTTTRAEVVAARAALQPFARAYLRKMDQLGEVQIQVFTDPLRPTYNRTIKLSDLKEAARVFASMSIGAEALSHLRSLEEFAKTTIGALESVLEKLSGEDRHALQNLLTMAKALASRKSL